MKNIISIILVSLILQFNVIEVFSLDNSIINDIILMSSIEDNYVIQDRYSSKMIDYDNIDEKILGININKIEYKNVQMAIGDRMNLYMDLLKQMFVKPNSFIIVLYNVTDDSVENKLEVNLKDGKISIIKGFKTYEMDLKKIFKVNKVNKKYTEISYIPNNLYESYISEIHLNNNRSIAKTLSEKIYLKYIVISKLALNHEGNMIKKIKNSEASTIKLFNTIVSNNKIELKDLLQMISKDYTDPIDFKLNTVKEYSIENDTDTGSIIYKFKDINDKEYLLMYVY